MCTPRVQDNGSPFPSITCILAFPNVVIDSMTKVTEISTGSDFWISKCQCIGSTKAIATKVCMFRTFTAKRHQDRGSKLIKVNVYFKLIYILRVYCGTAKPLWTEQPRAHLDHKWEAERESIEWPGLLRPTNPAPGTQLFPRLYCLILPKQLSQLGIVLKHMTLGDQPNSIS